MLRGESRRVQESPTFEAKKPNNQQINLLCFISDSISEATPYFHFSNLAASASMFIESKLLLSIGKLH
jgi:hypothetical protein